MPLLRVLLSATLPLAAVALLGGEARSSTTCSALPGGDRPPAVAGPAIRAVYALAAGAPDRRAERGPAIAADLERITRWWRAQDPTREPRFDAWASPCGVTADIGVVRLTESEESLRPVAGRAERIAHAVLRAGSGSPYAKTLVYYDGPADPPYCGYTPALGGEAAVSIVYTAACPAVPSAVVAAHELTHALGGTARSGPPHGCAHSEFHVCDSPSDILYPAVPRGPLETTVLDAGRDDYYGHDGDWADVRDSPWLAALDRQVTLAVTVNGGGRVLSDAPGVDCARPCTSSWNSGSYVVLRALAQPGRRFLGWSGTCTGRRACGIDLRVPARVHARFGPA